MKIPPCIDATTRWLLENPDVVWSGIGTSLVLAIAAWGAKLLLGRFRETPPENLASSEGDQSPAINTIGPGATTNVTFNLTPTTSLPQAAVEQIALRVVAEIGNQDLQQIGERIQGAAKAVERALESVEKAAAQGSEARVVADTVRNRLEAGDLEGAGAALIQESQRLEKLGAESLVAAAERAGQAAEISAGRLDFARTLRELERAISLARAAGRDDVAAQYAFSRGTALYMAGDAAGARAQYQLVADWRSTALGEDHPDTLAALNGLGSALLAEDRRAEAISTLEGAYLAASHSPRLGPEADLTLSTGTNLAEALRHNGSKPELEAARDLNESLLQIRRRKPDSKPVEIAHSLNSLGQTLYELGNRKAAKNAQEEQLKLAQREFGKDHLWTMIAKGNLASTLAGIGSRKFLRKAKRLHEENLAARRKALPPRHPDVLSSLHNLADVLWNLGGQSNVLQSIQALEEALPGRAEAHGPRHPETTSTAFALFHSLVETGNEARARQVFEAYLKWLLTADRSKLGAQQRRDAENLEEFLRRRSGA